MHNLVAAQMEKAQLKDRTISDALNRVPKASTVAVQMEKLLLVVQIKKVQLFLYSFIDSYFEFQHFHGDGYEFQDVLVNILVMVVVLMVRPQHWGPDMMAVTTADIPSNEADHSLTANSPITFLRKFLDMVVAQMERLVLSDRITLDVRPRQSLHFCLVAQLLLKK